MSSVFAISGRSMHFGAFTPIGFNPKTQVDPANVIPTFSTPVPGDDGSQFKSTLMLPQTVNTEPALSAPVDDGTIPLADPLGESTTWAVPTSSSSMLPLLFLAVAVGGYFLFKKDKEQSA